MLLYQNVYRQNIAAKYNEKHGILKSMILIKGDDDGEDGEGGHLNSQSLLRFAEEMT